MSGQLIIDGNSIGFAAHASPKLQVDGKEIQAVYGIIKTIRNLHTRYNSLQPIVLWDGGVNWRKDVLPSYKAHRDNNPKMAAMREAYRKQRPIIARGLATLGVWQIAADNMEADDLAGILVKRANTKGNRTVLITADNDWLQLVGPTCGWVDPIHDHVVSPKNFAAFTGFSDPRAFLQGKALQGDAGDFGPGSGVGGIGDKGAKQLLERFLSVENFMDRMNEAEPPNVPKKWADFSSSEASWQIFNRNMALMELPSPVAPPPFNLKINKGELSEDAFIEFCAELAFHSILKDIPAFMAPFQPVAEAA